MRTRRAQNTFGSIGVKCLSAAAALLLAGQAASAGTWTKVVNNPPGATYLMILLSDGTVMCANQNGSTIGSAWYRLTPNNLGSYVNGTWTTLASSSKTRLYYPSAVLKDGRVFVAGGEYGTGGGFAELYNPLTNTWTNITPPASLWNSAVDNFYDCNGEILTDGSVLTMPVFPHASGIGLRYHPTTNTWSNAGKLFRGTYQDEATWVKLPDESILTIDPFGTFSERYIPATNTWINDGIVPVALYDPFGFELGGAELLPNGKAFFLGSTGNTAFYTPTGTNAPGTWTAGPVIPGAHGTPDAPCAMMVDGKVLCAVSAVPTSANHFPSPTTFYEFDYVSNSFTSVNAPVGSSDPISAYQACMLCLPNGKILYSHMNTTVYEYTPSGAPIAAGKPTVVGVTPNGDGSYHLSGTLLNGISEGASYGDDNQMNTNYPLVRLTNGTNVYYGRTFNWSTTGVAKGALVSTTEYTLPASLPAGQYTLSVVVNGFASDPFCTTPATSNPSPKNVCAGGATTFTVSASGTTPTYQWRKGTTNLTDGGHFSGVTTSTLLISFADAGDAGSYNCVVSTPCGGSVTSGSATLTVNSCCPPDFNHDGFLTGEDFDAFVAAFEAGDLSADFNLDGFVNGDDFDDYVAAFETGC